MTNNSFTGDIDIAVIELGVNDTLVYDDDADTVSGKMKQLIDILHTDYPNCKVFVVGQKYATSENEYYDAYIWNDKIMDLNSAYQSLCENDNYKDFCNYVDCGALFHKLYGSTFERKPIYRGSTETTIKVTDWLQKFL